MRAMWIPVAGFGEVPVRVNLIGQAQDQPKGFYSLPSTERLRTQKWPMPFST